MSKYKYKEKDDIVYVKENDQIVSRYTIDKHWVEKNISEKDNIIKVRLYNRMKGYLDCEILINNDIIQKIPTK